MKQKPIIREYRAQDYAEVERLWEETGMGSSIRRDDKQTIEMTLKMGGKLFILEEPSTAEVIGTSWLTNDGRRIYLHHFGILPAFQGKGLSKYLLKSSMDYARSTGLQIKIEVHQTNTRAIKLYSKAGFKYLGDYNVYLIRDYQNIDYSK
ncbi:MAG: GNAT family N-acetyltransferase [Bacteroidales bacterium]|nr:GNAT family N-acetyltransferase [Bacteroidales bacterium]